MVSAVGVSQAVQQSQGGRDQQVLAQDFNDFLSLLTTQLQNQDPTSPLSTEEFTNQLVQFTAVEQQIATNSKLDELIALQLVDPLSSVSSFVGLTASYEGAEFFFDGENSPLLSYSLNDSADDTEIIVRDEFGLEIFRANGRTAPGAHEFLWTGRDAAGNIVPPGTYNIEVNAVGSDGEPIRSATLVRGPIRGIETDGLNTFLLIGERAIAQSQILRLEEPVTPIPIPRIEETSATPAGEDQGGDDTATAGEGTTTPPAEETTEDNTNA